ncbi:MAG: hypothetical protein HXX10_07570 [Rhodoplanes sp.]|uniref:hypothetical protein n=1 Tax=Rhodoplanes sp. TaxID=1968906 RepID=UPI0018046565|nr:hypothetical protein [Rhodoplanes sp.]NVO13879.1 hypothetical protein [Rhodoplanes sp.]
MKATAMLLAATVLAGCATAKPDIPMDRLVTLTEAQRKAIEAEVRTHLKDPDSARFGTIVAGANATETRVCGWVNSKNSYGGYGGNIGFHGTLDASGKFRFWGADDPSYLLIPTICRDHGLVI